MTTGLQIRKATSDDIPGMMHLFSFSLGIPKPASFFEWWNKFPSITYCAVDGGELAGMFVVLRRKLMNDLNCGVLMGLLVNHAWRGRGLFKDLGDQAMSHFEDIDFYCCLTNSVGEKALAKSFNFRTVGTIETLTRRTNKQGCFRGSTSTPITADSRFNNFTIPCHGRNIFFADAAFRQWRFATHPRCSYYRILLDSGEYVVINDYLHPQTNVRYVDIADFEAESLDHDHLVHLFDSVLSGSHHHADLATVQAVPDSLVYEVSKAMGFSESETRHYLCVKIKEPCNDYLYRSSNWLIKWGDYLR
jgi:hypothetical protein